MLEEHKIRISTDEKCATCGNTDADHDAQTCAQQSPQKPRRKRAGAVDHLLGKTVEGKYELLQVIGVGGWSKVYKARQGGVDRFVAFKVLHSHLLADTETLARFRQEAQAAGSLQHTNITAIHDYGVLEDGRPFIVLDFMEGQTFDKVIKAEGQLHLERVLHIILQICEGLKEAHSKNIVHRDLTPANIMLLPTEQGEHVKILDFGLAKVLSPQHESASLTRTGSTVGTPAYMSPEQCRGHRIDVRTDIYALGCVLYEAVTGKRAILGDSLLDCMNAHLTLEPEPIIKHRPELAKTPHWQAVIDRALNKDADARYCSIDEMVHDLRLLLPGKHRERFIARPETTWGSFRKKINNKRQILAVTALSLLCLSLAAIIAWRVDAIVHGEPNTVKELRVPKDANDATIAQALSQKPDAEVINLSECNITDEALNALKDFQTLRTLILNGTAITDEGLAKLESLNHLENLSLARTSLHGSGLPNLSKLTQLRSLDLGSTPMVDVDLAKLTSIPQVTKLGLSGTTIGGKGLVYLASLSGLSDLDLSSSALTADGLTRLPSLPCLTSLNLHSTIISDESVGHLKQMPMLENLNLSNTDISDKSADTICQLKSLKRLDLSNCHVSDSTCAKLAELPLLENLNLSNTDISDAGLFKLTNLSSLKNLKITGTKVSQEAKLQLLKTNPHCM
jgi:serine/threonine protein kinase